MVYPGQQQGHLLGKVEPVQAAAEALEHFRKRSKEDFPVLADCMAQLVCQLSAIAESERVDFRAVLRYAGSLTVAESIRRYEELLRTKTIPSPNERTGP